MPADVAMLVVVAAALVGGLAGWLTVTLLDRWRR